jgi:hypothetical protein
VKALRRETVARRSWFAPACAIGSILVGFLLGSCLNPRPEELPSQRGPVETVDLVPGDEGAPVPQNPQGSPGSGTDASQPEAPSQNIDDDSPPALPDQPPGEEGGFGGGSDAGADGGSAGEAPLVDGDP